MEKCTFGRNELCIRRLARQKLVGLVERLEEERCTLERERERLEEVARSVSFVGEAIRLKQVLLLKQDQNSCSKPTVSTNTNKNISMEKKKRSNGDRTLSCKEDVSKQRVVDALTNELSDNSQLDDRQQMQTFQMPYEQPIQVRSPCALEFGHSASPQKTISDWQSRQMKSEQQKNRQPFLKIDTNKQKDKTTDYKLRNIHRNEQFGCQKNVKFSDSKEQQIRQFERELLRFKVGPDAKLNFLIPNSAKYSDVRTDNGVRKLLFELSHKQSAPVNKYPKKDLQFTSKQCIKGNYIDRNERMLSGKGLSFGNVYSMFGKHMSSFAKYMDKRTSVSGEGGESAEVHNR